MASVVINIAGQRFGRLLALEEAGRDKFGEVKWRCRCDCGQERIVRGYKLRKSLTASCGCQKTEHIGMLRRTHGKSRSPEYISYRAMIRRCYDPTTRPYPWYGGRGVVVCERWLNSFLAFLKDVGPRPDGWTLDRIDPNGNYEPTNCRWAPWYVQARNKRKRLPPLPLLRVSQ